MSRYDSHLALTHFMSKVKRDGTMMDPTSQSELTIHAVDGADKGEEPTAVTQIDSVAFIASSADPSALETAVFVAGARLPPAADDQTPVKEFSRTLQDSSYAPGNAAKLSASKQPGMKNKLDDDPPKSPMTPTQIELLALKNNQKPNGPMRNAVESFPSTATSSSNQPEIHGFAELDVVEPAVTEKRDKTTPEEPTTVITDQGSTYAQDESSISNAIAEDGKVMSPTSNETPASSPPAADFKPSISIASPTTSPTPITVQRDPSFESLDPDAGALKQASDILASKIADVRVDVKEERGETPKHKVAVEGENREHATYFSAWGTPEARNKPKSCTRKAVLSGLPGNADYTFVQALIHGGTLEDITLSATGNTAYVLFTTGEACDNFCNKYPNGISMKHKGRSLTMFVDKGKDVDVVSSMLEAYLSAGASRVVRASNADEDWSMRALNRIAEGDNKRRKVEFISDEFRNETRTVVFRFANIADAVTFRNALNRDPEWEAAEIQFVADPCEKATGFHFE